MNPIPSIMPWDEDGPISECAAEFFARRRSGDWSAQDQAELDTWIAESILHEVAYLRVERIAARADQLAAFRALKLQRSAPVGDQKFRYSRFVFPVLAAASLALAS